jgi:hypothetical protein
VQLGYMIYSNRSYRIDARKLSDLLRTGLYSPVYHGQDGVCVQEKVLCSEGPTGEKRVYTRDRWRAKKLIPVQ